VRAAPPPWAALVLAGVGGTCAAVQAAMNAELGQRLESPVVAATINMVGGGVLIVLAVSLLPSMRAGLRVLRAARLPWWTYLGAVGGAFVVTAAAYAVPVLGVAAFTIAQVAGGSFGGLAVDRAGLAPLGRIKLTGPRVAGAVLGLAAVVLAQAGRPLGDLAALLVAVAVLAGVAVALQSALIGRLSAASNSAVGTAVNFGINAPVMLLVLGVWVTAVGWPRHWPEQWYLYLGGALGVCIVTAAVVSVRVVGVLRTGLAIVAGQLAGALLLDVLLPGGPGAAPALMAGAALTMLAVVVAGRGARPAGTPTPLP
jgi:transporter family-2 protein